MEVPGGGSGMLHQLGLGVMKTNSCYSARGERRKGEGGRDMRRERGFPQPSASYMGACTRVCALHEVGRERNARMRTLIMQ